MVETVECSNGSWLTCYMPEFLPSFFQYQALEEVEVCPNVLILWLLQILTSFICLFDRPGPKMKYDGTGLNKKTSRIRPLNDHEIVERIISEEEARQNLHTLFTVLDHRRINDESIILSNDNSSVGMLQRKNKSIRSIDHEIVELILSAREAMQKLKRLFKASVYPRINSRIILMFRNGLSVSIIKARNPAYTFIQV